MQYIALAISSFVILIGWSILQVLDVITPDMIQNVQTVIGG